MQQPTNVVNKQIELLFHTIYLTKVSQISSLLLTSIQNIYINLECIQVSIMICEKRSFKIFIPCHHKV